MRLTPLRQVAANRHGAASVGSGPRTRLPFLRKVVRDALRGPNTHNNAAPFKRYPLPSPGEEGGRASVVLYKDPQCIVVNDAYPKSRMHCLILPLDLSLESLNSLRAAHVPLLHHMMGVAERYVLFLRTGVAEKKYASLAFATGFHALPSLPQLHMHLISLDFDSPCLKSKKHYNTFATPFFLPADRVVEDLERNDCVTLNRDVAALKSMEEQAPCCMWCNKSEAGMPQLKAHLLRCPKSGAFIKPVDSA
ncbi:aprataxin [Trypanosoma grayi]|uniref:aprataxin n=1 Tax=Trypanosoma grayi TaxID=71804 RepID=UPI0004F457CE|nr:aprataxin [Trypanosoma grayi]KEG10257.1 aprataxin [Trypanosoma grayi]